MRRPLPLLLALALVLAAAVPAAADPDAPTLRSERVYFACPATNTKVHNIEQAQGRYAGWRLTAPTTSFTAGGGCGTVDPPVTSSASPRNVYDAAWTGTFTGNLERMVIEAHSIDTLSRTATTASYTVTVQVDGTTVLAKSVTVPYTRSATQLSQKMVFSVDKLPFKTEKGDGTKQRAVTVAFSSPTGQGVHGFVWDTTEVPSGIIFNGDLTGPVLTP